MDNIKLRRDLLENMCNCAENISSYFNWGPRFTNTYFDGFECPEAFKPGVADKFIFNQIINSVVDNIDNELKERNITNKRMISIEIMAIYYYPYYGTWKKIDRRF